MTDAGAALAVLPVSGLPEVSEGALLGELIAARAELEEGDVVVVSQKVVSKAEGRVRPLSSAIPGAEARRLAAALGKDPALVELILSESREVLRAERGVLIVETLDGLRLRQRRHRHLEHARPGHRLPPPGEPRRLRPSPSLRNHDGDREEPHHRRRDRRQLRESLAAGPVRRGDRLRGPRPRSTTGAGAPTPPAASWRRP